MSAPRDLKWCAPSQLPYLITEVLEVSIELRAPRAGEVGWWVQADATPEAMLADVIAGRDHDPRGGVCGFGWRADSDFYAQPGNDVNEGERAITVVVKRAGKDA